MCSFFVLPFGSHLLLLDIGDGVTGSPQKAISPGLSGRMYCSLFVWDNCRETGLIKQVIPTSIVYGQLLTSIAGAIRFPYAETLPFPYFNFVFTHVCMLLGGLFARSINKSLDDLEGREGDRFTSPSSLKNATCALNCVAIPRIFPLTLTIAAEAAMGNYVLYNIPFEAYLLSRAFVLPFLLLLGRFIYANVGSGRLLYPSTALSISVLITAFKPPFPHSGRTLLVVVSSSILSALWFLQVQIRNKPMEPPSKGEYSAVGSAETMAKKGSTEAYSSWSLLYYASLLSTIVLVPVVLYSGEPGYILRNCYF
jgi:hypothetical protein